MMATAAGIETRPICAPPVAKRVPAKVTFGVNPADPNQFRGNNAMNPPITREDPYFWLRDTERKDPEVLGYLDAENKYTEAALAPLKGFREKLYKEMLSHLQETDEDVPYRLGAYLYYSKTVKGLSYKIHCRRPVNGGEDEVVLDENILAQGHEYCDVGAWEPSPSHRFLAYSVDHSGYETYTIRVIKNIATREEAVDVVEGTDGSIVWAADDSAFFYLTLDEEHRPHKVYLHVLGTPQSDDICLLSEDDGRFWLHVTKTTDEKYLILHSGSKETSEGYFADLTGLRGVSLATQLPQRLTCFARRRQGLRYEDVEHRAGDFFLVTNKDNAVNNKLVRVPVAAYATATAAASASAASDVDYTQLWEDVRGYNDREQIDHVLALKDHLVVEGRREGLSTLWIVPGSSSKAELANWQPLSFPEASYMVWLAENYEYDSSTLRVGYSSLLTPRQILDVDLTTKRTTLLKEQCVPGYDRSQYDCQRIWAKSRDGVTCIPISLVYHRSLLNAPSRYTVHPENGQLRFDVSRPENCLYRSPCLLYGYGSYGYPLDPTFDFKRLALLDRGVIFAIAHIRGGGEFGRSWYETTGKYLHKMNTFHDFADCAKALMAQQITAADRLAIVGRSAGGLLVGATLNLYPTLFKVAVADVPFVDVLNTMSDPSIPLTVTEWEEWGNPNEKDFHDYISRYSPYDNIKPQRYPALLVTAGLHDPRVPYWEAAKYVAKLRATKPAEDKNPVYLKTDLSSGHFSASDRYKYLQETAFEYAFILDQLRARSRHDERDEC